MNTSMGKDEISIMPLRFGVRFSPPALVYVYERRAAETTTAGILRRRIMPVRDFFHSSDIESTAKTLLERHGRQLFRDVPIEVVCKMLRLLREHKNGADLKTGLEIVNEEAKELQRISDMVKKTDDSYQRAVQSSRNSDGNSKDDSFNLPSDKKEGIQDLDVENTWDDDDGGYSLEFPVDRIVT